jgi:hypothetical protein
LKGNHIRVSRNKEQIKDSNFSQSNSRQNGSIATATATQFISFSFVLPPAVYGDVCQPSIVPEQFFDSIFQNPEQFTLSL